MHLENLNKLVSNLVRRYNGIILESGKRMNRYSHLISDLDKSVNDFMHELEAGSFSDIESQLVILRRLKSAVVQRRNQKDKMQKTRCLEKMNSIEGFGEQLDKKTEVDLFSEIRKVHEDIEHLMEFARSLNVLAIPELKKIKSEISAAYSKLKEIENIHRTRKYEKRSSLPVEYFTQEKAMSL